MDQEVIKYTYSDEIIKELILDNRELFIRYNTNDMGDNLTKKSAENTIKQLLKNVYLIESNPLRPDYILLVYEKENSNEAIFYEYNNSRKVYKTLEKQYNKIDKVYNINFTYYCDYDTFISKLKRKIFKEVEKTSSNIHLVDNNKIYDFNNKQIKNTVNELPTKTSKIKCNIDEKEYNSDKEILDKYFRLMYPDDPTFKQFLFYILCNFDKKYVNQSIFLIVDTSGVGKTSRILPMVNLGLNKIATSGLLKPTELYNLVNCNSIIFNEIQDSKTINGAILNILCDNSPLEVTRKKETSINLNADDKPLIQLMGEVLPIIKSLSDGTTRRLLLTPKASTKYIQETKKATNEIKQFFNILNHKDLTVINYYLEKIQEYNIIDEIETIRKSMKINLSDLNLLKEDKEEILENYFILTPFSRYETDRPSVYLIETKDSLKQFLEYIDTELITVNHFNDVKLMKKYLRDVIKENLGISSINNLGKVNRNKKNYMFCYQLTPEAVALIDKMNAYTPKKYQIDYKIF